MSPLYRTGVTATTVEPSSRRSLLDRGKGVLIAGIAFAVGTVCLVPQASPSDPGATAGPFYGCEQEPYRSRLRESWEQYVRRFIQGDGRVIDLKSSSASTSEGQAYAMIRALAMDDRQTFDRVFKWANDNLNAQVRSDHLYAWKWGPRDDGSWGTWDTTAASDADQWIAASLLEASRRWEGAYRAKALDLLHDIYMVQTKEVLGKRYVFPGDWPSTPGPIRLNPSYYLPFLYRDFQKEDPGHDWNALVDTSYLVFSMCRSRVGLPVDWCLLDPKDGRLQVAVGLEDRSSDFGYDAFRVLWHLAGDHFWSGEPRALELLKQTDYLQRYYGLRKMLPAVVTVDGIPLVDHDYPGMYGAWLPVLGRLEPSMAEAVLRDKLEPQYHGGLWANPIDYYAQNWVWFGLQLYCQAVSSQGQERARGAGR